MSRSDVYPLPPRRGPGRPREFERPSHMTIRLDASLHDRIVQEADKRGIPVGRLARELMLKALGRWPQ